jgi:hypothetical protein
MRMGMRRLTRLINGFSKKLENHRHALRCTHALQLLPDSLDAERYASNGGWTH